MAIDLQWAEFIYTHHALWLSFTHAHIGLLCGLQCSAVTHAFAASAQIVGRKYKNTLKDSGSVWSWTNDFLCVPYELMPFTEPDNVSVKWNTCLLRQSTTKQHIDNIKKIITLIWEVKDSYLTPPPADRYSSRIQKLKLSEKIGTPVGSQSCSMLVCEHWSH